MTRILSALFYLTISLSFAAPAIAQPTSGTSNEPVRIGVLTDMTGPFSDISGPGAVLAVRMAVEDFGGKVLGRPINILAADHQNKPDIGLAVAREWFDRQGVVMVQDLMNSAVALAVIDLAAGKDRVAIVNGASTSLITNENCTANRCTHLGHLRACKEHRGRCSETRGRHLVLRDRGLRIWARARSRHRGIRQCRRRAGPWRSAPPAQYERFFVFSVQAKASGAKIIGLANAGSDTINAIKTAAESASPNPTSAS